MVTFDHRDAGTPEHAWADARRFATVPEFAAVPRVHALVVAAHPDDESLGAGGLIAALAQAGTRITIVLATRGERSHPPDSTRERESGPEPDRASPLMPDLATALATDLAPDLASALAARRISEFESAVRTLAPDCHIVEAGLPDGELPQHTAALESLIAGIVQEHSPGTPAVDLIVAPWRGDGHGDHQAAGDAAAAVAQRAGVELLEYPIWLWHWATPDSESVPWPDLVLLPLDPAARRAKQIALDCYVSQRDSIDGAAPILHAGMLAHFERAWEVFVRTPAPRSAAPQHPAPHSAAPPHAAPQPPAPQAAAPVTPTRSTPA